MISGNATKRYAWLTLVAIALATTCQASENGFLPELFSAIAAQSQNSVQYEERKHVSYLEQPLTSNGTLLYEPPDTIIRTQMYPDKTIFSVIGSEIAMQSGSRRKVLNIDRVPMMQAFRQAMRGVLDGNLAMIADFASLTPKGTISEWEFELKPKNKALAKAVRNIIFRGQHGAITEIEINEANGDWSVMTLSPLPAVGDGR